MVFFGRSLLGKLWTREADSQAAPKVENEAAWEDAEDLPVDGVSWDWDLLEDGSEASEKIDLAKPMSKGNATQPPTTCTVTSPIEFNCPKRLALAEEFPEKSQSFSKEVACTDTLGLLACSKEVSDESFPSFEIEVSMASPDIKLAVDVTGGASRLAVLPEVTLQSAEIGPNEPMAEPEPWQPCLHSKSEEDDGSPSEAQTRLDSSSPCLAEASPRSRREVEQSQGEKTSQGREVLEKASQGREAEKMSPGELPREVGGNGLTEEREASQSLPSLPSEESNDSLCPIADQRISLPCPRVGEEERAKPEEDTERGSEVAKEFREVETGKPAKLEVSAKEFSPAPLGAKSTLLESVKRPAAVDGRRWWEPGNVVALPSGSQDELAKKLQRRLAKVESEGKVLQSDGCQGLPRADAKAPDADEARAAWTEILQRSSGSAHRFYAQKRNSFFDFEELEELDQKLGAAEA
mmetsp:Transcript_82884/g.146463  ORF Transcript_82884/g.146463 Transcript_82884/m.146463 type:complete len:465 (+) Transcript_82884:173-1567(+)